MQGCEVMILPRHKASSLLTWSDIPFYSRWAIHVVKHQNCYSIRTLGASFCVTMMIQQRELTDWWNNEQRHAGRMRVCTSLRLLFKLLYANLSSGSLSSSLPCPCCLGMIDVHACRNSLSDCWKTNRFENFFSFRGPRWLHCLCVIWEPLMFRHTFLYLLIHLRLASALMLLTAELSWFCHQRSSKGGVQSLWRGLQGLRRSLTLRWKDVKHHRGIPATKTRYINWQIVR